MCGLAGVHRRGERAIPKVDRLADELLLELESRGRDATGFLALMENGKVQLQKKAVPASRFVRDRGRIHARAKTVLLHTRFKTVGDKRDPRNAHPVASGKVAAVHNGTIYNADEIFRLFKLPRIGSVDSEVIPALIHHAGWSNLKVSLGLLQGGAATAIVNTDHPDEVVLARLRTYPLYYAVTRDLVIWASTPRAIRSAWYRTYRKHFNGKIIELGEGELVKINGSVEKYSFELAPERFRAPRVPRLVSKQYAPPKRKTKKRSTKKSVPPVRARGPKQPRQQELAPQFDYDAVASYTTADAIVDLMECGVTAATAREIVRDAQGVAEDLLVAVDEYILGGV